jgi:hypothetical protein
MNPQSELEKAVQRPWDAYKTPEEVLADRSLSDEDKRRVLESWERDARELAVAEEENMGGGEPNMLHRVLQALNELPAPDERPRGPATKHGAQPTPSSAPADSGARDSAPTLTGQEARQGEIILNTPARRAIFIGSLGIAALVGLLLLY